MRTPFKSVCLYYTFSPEGVQKQSLPFTGCSTTTTHTSSKADKAPTTPRRTGKPHYPKLLTRNYKNQKIDYYKNNYRPVIILLRRRFSSANAPHYPLNRLSYSTIIISSLESRCKHFTDNSRAFYIYNYRFKAVAHLNPHLAIVSSNKEKQAVVLALLAYTPLFK